MYQYTYSWVHVFIINQYSRTDVKQHTLNEQIEVDHTQTHTGYYCYVPVTKEVLREREDCEVDWFVVTSIILSVRLKTAPSILHKNIMPVLNFTSVYAPFGRPKTINFKLYFFFWTLIMCLSFLRVFFSKLVVCLYNKKMQIKNQKRFIDKQRSVWIFFLCSF